MTAGDACVGNDLMTLGVSGGVPDQGCVLSDTAAADTAKLDQWGLEVDSLLSSSGLIVCLFTRWLQGSLPYAAECAAQTKLCSEPNSPMYRISDLCWEAVGADKPLKF